MWRHLLLVFGLSVAGALAQTDPAWWSNVVRSGDSHALENNYAPANLGQLKHFADKAKAHLDAKLPGGSGSSIETMVAGWTESSEANYAPVNVGQLKNVADKFYDRLNEVGFNFKTQLTSNGYGRTWTSAPAGGSRPWNEAMSLDSNYAPANLGQLKMMFSFDLSGDPFNGGPPPPPKPWVGGDGQNIILGWSSGLGIASYTVERWENGAWVTVSTNPGSGPGSTSCPNVTDGGGSSNLAPGVIYLYRVTASAINGHSSETVLGAVPNPDANDDTDTLTNGEEVDAGYYCKEFGDGEIDAGTLKMGGNPTGWVGPDPKLGDTDLDTEKDDTDGWANNPDISTAPRLPAFRYAAIAIDQMGFPLDYTPIAVNDKCQVVGYKEDLQNPHIGFYKFWDIKTGQSTTIDLDGVPQWQCLNNSGVVCGWEGATNDNPKPAIWTKTNGPQLLEEVVPEVMEGYDTNSFSSVVVGINEDGEVSGTQYFGGWLPNEDGYREGISAVTWGNDIYGPINYVTVNYDPYSNSVEGDKYFTPRLVKTGLQIGSITAGWWFDNPPEDEGRSAIYDSALKVLDEFDVATAANDIGYVVGQRQEIELRATSSQTLEDKKLYLWIKKEEDWEKKDLILGRNHMTPVFLNNRFELTDFDQWKLIRNGVPLDLADLLGSKWVGYGLINGLNNFGVMVAEGTPAIGQSHKYLLVPIELYDDAINSPTVAFNGESITLAQVQEIPDVDTLAYISDGKTAWIKAHKSATDAAPEMPKLVARAPIPGASNITYKWRLEVEYKRPNGRVMQEDKVKIPTNGSWAEVTADKEWRIFEWKAPGASESDWDKEIAQRGFFGGTAKLYFWNPANGPEPEDHEQTYTFHIGGKNPEDPKCKTFITETATSVQQPMAWFVYAIAKHESQGYNDGVNGQQDTRYNQFWDATGRFAKVNHHAGEVLWVDNPGEDPPKGFGMFQVTGNKSEESANIPRKQLWNWQDNVRGGLDIIASKRGIANRYFGWIQRKSPTHKAAYLADPPPNIPVGSHNFSSADAIQIYGYNGTGRINGRTAIIHDRYPFDPNKPPGLGSTKRWFWNPHNVKGGEPYIKKVERELE